MRGRLPSHPRCCLRRIVPSPRCRASRHSFAKGRRAGSCASCPAIPSGRSPAARPAPGPRPSIRRPRRIDRPCPIRPPAPPKSFRPTRSEEHTSELQSLMRISYAVFCLKKKKSKKTKNTHYAKEHIHRNKYTKQSNTTKSVNIQHIQHTRKNDI